MSTAYSGVVRAKHWYALAAEQTTSRHPLAAGVTVSLLQDSVESLAHAAAGAVKIDISAKAAFIDYWDKFPGPKKLPYRTEMSSLNNARVLYKHHGVLPAPAEAERLSVLAHRFLVETTQEFFGMDFDQMSEVDLVAIVDCRDSLRSAEVELKNEALDTALHRCRDALDALITELRRQLPWGRPQIFGPRVQIGRELFEWVKAELDEYSLAILLISVGIVPLEYQLASRWLPTPSANRANYWFNLPSPPSKINVAETIRAISRMAIRVQSAVDKLQPVRESLENPTAPT
jgi:hypothetical protein